MSWIDDIFSLIWDISVWFYYIADEAAGIAFVGPTLKFMFTFVADGFWSLLTPIAHFHDWTYDIDQAIANILSSIDIIALLRDWLNWAQWSWEWIQYAWLYVTDIVEAWWSSTQLAVQGWISIATEGLDSLRIAWSAFWTITWPEWTGKLDNLTSELHSFFTLTLPGLVNFDWLISWWNDRLLDVQSIINTAFIDRDSWWSGWIDVKNEVIEFIASPLDWLEGKLADWFLGPEV